MACKLCEDFRKKYPLEKNNDLGEETYIHRVNKFLIYEQLKCAFEDNDYFNINNWSCQTIIKLREIAEKHYVNRYNDESIAVIPIPENDYQNGFLVMTWYKNRGKTGQAWVMCDDDVLEVLLLKTAEFIIERSKYE